MYEKSIFCEKSQLPNFKGAVPLHAFFCKKEAKKQKNKMNVEIENFISNYQSIPINFKHANLDKNLEDC